MSHCQAIIDIGSNSVKLLVAQVDKLSITSIFETSETTRLSEKLNSHSLLSAASINHTLEVIKKFYILAQKHGATLIRAYGTQALRECKNAPALLDPVFRETNLAIKILSEKQEAQFIFQGVTTDPFLPIGPLLVIDLGGGSAEFIVGHGQTIQAQASFRIGCLPMKEKWITQYPILKTERHALETDIAREVALFFKNSVLSPNIVLTGGTVFSLAKVLEPFEKNRFSTASLVEKVNMLTCLSLDALRTDHTLPLDRIDLLPVGGIILTKILSISSAKTFFVSKRNLRYGLILQAN